MAEVWLAITILCSGHTNATCWFETDTFKNKQECVTYLTEPRERCLLFSIGCESKPRKIDKRKMCIPLAGEPVIEKGFSPND